MKKILTAAGVSALAVLGAGAYVFHTACPRKKEDTRPVEERVDPLWAEYKEGVFEGIRWFHAQEREPVEILSHDGLKLRGSYLAHPEAKGTILLFHGYRTDGFLDFSCVYSYYYGLGYSLLHVFQRSHRESEGKFITFGAKERFDCQRWAQYAYERFGAEHPLLLDGMSMGASTVLMAAGLELPPTVRGIIADCGFTSGWEEIRYLIRKAHVPCGGLVLRSADLFAKHIAGFSFRECSTVEALQNCKIPVLLIHGGDDDFVPPHFSEENYCACGSRKELHIVPKAKHGTSYMVDLERCQTALERFLQECTEG
ncbi:MAG: alpha/beta hydrolase [Oscillospiraceae bacterium]|nr:alpha/beta hydrolase [Oscillospiraceae bacterium]